MHTMPESKRLGIACGIARSSEMQSDGGAVRDPRCEDMSYCKGQRTFSVCCPFFA